MSDASAVKQVADHLKQRIKDTKLDVPLLPETASKVVTLSQDPESDATELAQLIQADPTLAGHVMRIANSAAYTPSASLVSLQQAITRLGMNLISEIALAASISSKMFSAPGFSSHIDQIWRHALATALWGKEVARAARRSVEATFLCGLLHSIGKPVALQEISDICAKEGLTLSEDEVMKITEHYHFHIALAVLEEWGMPQIVKDVVKCLGQCAKTGSCQGGSAEQANMVRAGDLLASHTEDSEALNLETLIAADAFAELNIYDDEIELILNRADSIKGTMEAMLG